MDQHNQHSNGPERRPPPNRTSIEKTFIEGNDARSARPPLAASSIGASNTLGGTFSKTMGGEVPDASMLPTGNEKIPLGSGTLTGLLGSGGMARVYQIWNEKLEVNRAVKILIPTKQKDLKSRFETEAKITAKLHHPNIVEIYNVGEWNGLPYIEMEFLDGSTLEAMVCKYGKLPTTVCSAVAIFIARALVYAHSQETLIYGKTYHGIIHRDLKPANIILSNNGQVRLMDFGIARPTEASLHTVEGNIVGTMQYLSPEQMDGSDIDCRTDIYSFGAIMYELITGMKTFPQDTITSLMRHKIVNEYRKFSEFEFAIAPSLARITQKCLQSSKGHRYASAVDLLKELESTHKLLTIDEPDQVLISYMRDPENFVQPESKKTLRLPTHKINKLLIPLIAAIVLVAVVGGFLATIVFKSDQSVSIGPVTKQVPAPAPSSPGVTPTPPAVTVDQGELKPLSPRTPEVSPKTVYDIPQPQRQPRPGRTPKTALFRKPPVQQTKPDDFSVASVENAVPRQADPAVLIERLRQKYGTSDHIVIARNCIQAGRAADAIKILESEQENVDPTLKALTLFEAYIETRNTKEALPIALDKDLLDAQYDYLCGRLYQSLHKNLRALDYYAIALTKPSRVRKSNEIRNDALYYSALIRDELYRIEPTQENRIQATNAWTVIKRLYGAVSDHPRAKKAEEALSTIN